MLYLSVNKQQFPLINGRQFSEAELSGLSSGSEGPPVARVSVNPTNPSILGLKNLTLTTWRAVLPSGAVKTIEPERTIKLERGTKIIFGSYAAEVIDLATPSRSYVQQTASTIDPESISSFGTIREGFSSHHEPVSDPFAWSLPRRWLPALIGLIILLIAWQIISLIIGVVHLPGPIDVVAKTWPYISQPFYDNGGLDKGLGWQIIISLSNAAAGCSIGSIIGISIGTLIGFNHFISKSFDPVIQLSEAVPPLALLPLFLFVFQSSKLPALFVVVVASIWPITTQIANGIREIKQDFVTTGKQSFKKKYVWPCHHYIKPVAIYP